MIKLYYQNGKVGKMDIKVKNLYYLGPQGSYAQSAVKQFVSDLKISAENFIPLNPITKILQTIDEDKDSIAVLPIENSIEGIVRETIDNIIKKELNIMKIRKLTLKNLLNEFEEAEEYEDCDETISDTSVLNEQEEIEIEEGYVSAKLKKDHGVYVYIYKNAMDENCHY